MLMSLRDDVLADLATDEGKRLKPYDDDTGLELRPGDTLKGSVTISCGVNLSVGITQAESDYLSGGRLDVILSEINAALPWLSAKPEAVQRAVANICYNEGVHGFVTGWPKCIAHLKADEFEGAAAEVLDGPWKAQVGARADRVATLIRNAGAIS